MTARINALWPSNLDARVDIITPYPCQTCKKPFNSRKRLATHDCKPERKTEKENV